MDKRKETHKRQRMRSVPRLTPQAESRLVELGLEVNGSSLAGITAMILEAASECSTDNFYKMLATMKEFRAKQNKAA